MPTAVFKLTLKGFPGIQHVLDRYGKQLSDLKPLWTIFEKHVMPMNAVSVFTRGQTTWPEYKNSGYRSWKHRHGFYRTKLRKTGRLYQAFKVPGSPGNLSIKKRDSWTYGVNLSHDYFANRSGYPALHNVGSGNLQRRQWAVLSNWARRRMKIIFYRYVKAIMQKRSFKYE